MRKLPRFWNDHVLQSQYKGGAEMIRGMIVPFYGAYIPAGWALCDGTNGTPNLIGRTVMGSTVALRGVASGSNTATLVVANMPAHNHGASTATAVTTSATGSHSHNFYMPNVDNGPDEFFGVSTNGRFDIQPWQTSSVGNHSHTLTVPAHTHTTQGSGTAFSVLNANTTLVYIMKL